MKIKSADIDFVSADRYEKIESALAKIGFVKDENRNFIRRKHLKGDIRDSIFIDYVGLGTQIGEENVPRKALARIAHDQANISILTPTHTVMDRLAKFYHYRDTDALNHAVIVAKKYPVNLARVKKWSEGEQHETGYGFFLARLKMSSAKPDDYSDKIIEKLKSKA